VGSLEFRISLPKTKESLCSELAAPAKMPDTTETLRIVMTA